MSVLIPHSTVCKTCLFVCLSILCVLSKCLNPISSSKCWFVDAKAQNSYTKYLCKIPMGHPNSLSNTRGWKNWWYLTSVLLYVGNNTRWECGYYGAMSCDLSNADIVNDLNVISAVHGQYVKNSTYYRSLIKTWDLITITESHTRAIDSTTVLNHKQWHI